MAFDIARRDDDTWGSRARVRSLSKFNSARTCGLFLGYRIVATAEERHSSKIFDFRIARRICERHVGFSTEKGSCVNSFLLNLLLRSWKWHLIEVTETIFFRVSCKVYPLSKSCRFRCWDAVLENIATIAQSKLYWQRNVWKFLSSILMNFKYFWTGYW